MRKAIFTVIVILFAATVSAQMRDIKGTIEKAKAGDPEAQYNLGISYETGDGLKQDLAQAVGWYEKAVANGNPGACYRLGLLYEFGQGVAADPDKALTLYEKAGLGGSVDAQMKLADHYGGDRQKAFFWMKKAAEAGLPVAQYNTATSYQVGDGVEKNYEQAVYWYKKAIESGMPQAAPALKELEDTLAKRKVPQS